MTQPKWQDTFPGWSKHRLEIPLVVAERDELSVGAKLTYGLLRYLSWRQSGEIEVTVAEAAAMLGASERSMRDWLRELANAELATSTRRGLGLTNAYTVHPPRYGNTYDGSAISADQERQNQPVTSRARQQAKNKGIELKASIAPPARKQPRKRDLPFDAMAEVTASDPTLEGSAIAKAVNHLRKHPDYLALVEARSRDEAEATLANAIHVRADQYAQHFPDIALTPSALVRHWKRVQHQPRSRRRADVMSPDLMRHHPLADDEGRVP